MAIFNYLYFFYYPIMIRYLVIFCFILLMSCSDSPKEVHMQTLYVGTYTDGSSEGIYSLKFNPEIGILDSLELKAKL